VLIATGLPSLGHILRSVCCPTAGGVVMGGALAGLHPRVIAATGHCPLPMGLHSRGSALWGAPVGLLKAAAFSQNSDPHIPGIPTGDELRSVLNKDSLPSSSQACGLPSPAFIGDNSRIELSHSINSFVGDNTKGNGRKQ